jgi:hypothetical protein
MGKHMGWLGSGSLPSMQWVRERLMSDEDWVIVECVTSFDHSMLEKLLGDRFSLTVLNFSPTLLGIPVMRKRKYMILLKKGSLQWDSSIAGLGPQGAFELLVARKVTISGDCLCRAPCTEVSDSVATLVVKRGFPTKRRSGR